MPARGETAIVSAPARETRSSKRRPAATPAIIESVQTTTSDHDRPWLIGITGGLLSVTTGGRLVWLVLRVTTVGSNIERPNRVGACTRTVASIAMRVILAAAVPGAGRG